MNEDSFLRLLEEVRKSNNSIAEFKQLIPRLEKIELNQDRLYKEFLVHQALMKPEDFKLLAERVQVHDKAIHVINSELGLNKKQIEEQKDGIKSFFNKAWDILIKLITPGSVIYLILESKEIL